ncbi:MAG: adenylate kinase family protein [bacterium]|jgi:adenylate kinase
MQILILFGPPGSGKGTQVNKIIQYYPNSISISTGDILRENIKNNTELGKLANNYICKGLLVPDEIINSMIENKFNQIQNNNIKFIILDGYPRSINQLYFLLKLIPKDVIKTIYLKIDLQEVIKRITYRRICPNCNKIYHLIYNKPKNNETCDNCNTKLIQREDDKEEVVVNRFNVYNSQTLPIINEIIKNNMKLLEINANQDIETIFNIIIKYLENS